MIAAKVDQLWTPEPLSISTSPKTMNVGNGGDNIAASDVLTTKCGPDAGVDQTSSKCAAMARRSESKAETRFIVAGFGANAHLARDLRPDRLAELRRITSDYSDIGVSSSPAIAPDEDATSNDTSRVESSMPELAASATQPHLAPVPEGVPAGTAVLLALAAFALGIAFQNQRVWAQITAARYSPPPYTRDEYTSLS